MIGNNYDYTDKNEGILKTRWFTETIKSRKAQWLNPTVDPVSNFRVITYAIPFYFDDEKEPAGVIAISYRLRKFWEIAQNIGVGETGYTFILSHDQVFLYHPILPNIEQKKTLLQFAQEEGNSDLEYIAQEIKNGKPFLQKFSNRSAHNSSWIYSQPIDIAGWTLATVFSSNEIGLSISAIKAHIFDVTVYLSITFLLILALLCRFYSAKPIMSFLTFSNFILVITIMCLWYTVDKASRLENGKNIFIIDQSSVNNFINTQVQEAKRKNEPTPITIPCGIELYSMQQSTPTSVTFSGIFGIVIIRLCIRIFSELSVSRRPLLLMFLTKPR